MCKEYSGSNLPDDRGIVKLVVINLLVIFFPKTDIYIYIYIYINIYITYICNRYIYIYIFVFEKSTIEKLSICWLKIIYPLID